MANNRVTRVLQNMGFGALAQNFEDQKLDNVELLDSLTDNELNSLGLKTIGDRATFRSNVRKESTTFSSANTRDRVTQLFRPARSGTTGRTRSKQQVRTWTGQFVCLSDVNATRTPSSSEKISLQSAGLGHKKIQFRLDDNEEEVFKILSTEEKGFPQLYNIGGFELLHCTSNCRELQRLNCKWDVESLQKIIGSQAKIYLRPIQRNLKVIAHSVPEATSLEAECENCHNKFILSELREHVKDCNNEENDVVLLDDEKENETLENVEEGENAEEINEEVNKSESTIQETVDDIITTCKSNNINDPIDILRICQNKIVQGRTLDIIDDADVLSGGTNYIMVDREDILKSAMTEIDEIDNLRLCLEVQFYGETAADFGGPRKEFFGIVLREMKEQYFDNIKEWSPDYVVLGEIMALSLLQNGKLPKVLSADLVEEVFKSDSMRPCVQDLRKGLDSLGIYQLSITLPMVVHLFTPGPQQHMKFRQLTSILTPQFSPEGSNRRKRESAIYSLFVKYIREAASGRRGMVDLRCILRFATGTEEEPALGYSIDPSIQFVEGTSFMPTANTCINKMNLTIPDSNEVSVGKDFLFNLFDYAFSNTFFGMK